MANQNNEIRALMSLNRATRLFGFALVFLGLVLIWLGITCIAPSWFALSFTCPNWSVTIFGIVFVIVISWYVVQIDRWHKELIQLYRSVQPVRGTVTIERVENFDTVSYTAQVSIPSDSTTWKLSVISTGIQPDAAALRYREAQIYLHPQDGIPCIIETEDKVWWREKGST